MSRHLSQGQLSHWVAGEHPESAGRHLEECAACRGEVERAVRALELFRESADRWSDRWSQAPRTPAQISWNWPRLAAAGTMVAALVAAAVWIGRAPVPPPAEQPFVEIPYVAPLAPYERASVVRMDVPVAALIAAGFESHGEPDGAVRADVLVGQDGRAHAIRLHSDSTRSIPQ